MGITDKIKNAKETTWLSDGLSDDEINSIIKDAKCKPRRCIDPVMKFCQECKYGWIHYPDWVETYEDTFDCTFESGCIYGLENTEPTTEELEEFDDMMKAMMEADYEASI